MNTTPDPHTNLNGILVYVHQYLKTDNVDFKGPFTRTCYIFCFGWKDKNGSPLLLWSFWDEKTRIWTDNIILYCLEIKKTENIEINSNCFAWKDKDIKQSCPVIVWDSIEINRSQ